jgi:hypothetical protein
MFVCHFVIAGIFAQYQNQWAVHQGAGAGWVSTVFNASRCLSGRLTCISSQAAIAFVWLFVINFGYSW